MSVGKINKRSVDALCCGPGRRETQLWDTDLSRFIVIAYQTGRKTYAIQYQIGAKEVRRKIGTHGAFTPEEARAKAKRLLAEIDNGKDPFAPVFVLAVPTFNEMADSFMNDHVGPKREESTRKGYEGCLSTLRPALGHLRANEITTQVVISFQKTGVSKPGASNRQLSLLSAIWNYAKRTRDEGLRGIFRYNPVDNVEKYPEQERTRFLSLAEMRRFGEALDKAQRGNLFYEVDETRPGSKHAPRPENRIRRVDPFAIAALRLLLLTGARKSEILKAQWSWVDFDSNSIVLPKSKSGRQPKPLVLSEYAVGILQSLPRVNVYIIPGKVPDRPRFDLKNPWNAIMKEARIENLTIHGLRHSFASTAARKSMGLPMIGALLGHTQVQTTKRYAHLDLEPMRNAVQLINSDMAAALDAKKMLQGSSPLFLPPVSKNQ